MNPSALCFYLLSAVASAAPDPAEPGSFQQGPAAEPGVPGTVAPQSADVRLADTLVNQDQKGGSNQFLLSLAASPGAGFAAVWRDQRDGMLGLYMARLSPQGELLEPERPIHQPHSGRRVDPAIALGKDNSGAVVWVSQAGGSYVPWVRTFDNRGSWLTVDRMVAQGEGGHPSHQGRDLGVHMPVVAALPHGGYAMAWMHGGQVMYQELEHDGAPHGNLLRLAPSSPPAEAGVQIAVSARGSVLCVWHTQAGNLALNHGRSDTAPVNCGTGVLCRLITDPVGGFWSAFLVDGQAVLRHLSVDGQPDRPELKPIPSAATGLDLALGDDYMALLVETGSVPRGGAGAGRGRASGGAPRAGGGRERGASGDRDDSAAGSGRTPVEDGRASPFAVYLLDRDGRSSDSGGPIRVSSSAAVSVSGPRLVSNGKRVFVAWTDQRNGDQDIYGRILEPSGRDSQAAADSDPRLGVERRVNTDVASSDQNGARIAGAGQCALIAWQDNRDQLNRVFVRLVGPKGFASDEFSLPAPFGADTTPPESVSRIQPAVAIRADGQFAVQWKEVGGHSGVMRTQCFHADKTPVALPVAIDGENVVSTDAIAAAGGDRGYLIAWIRGNNGGVWTRRLALDGTLSAPVRVAEGREGELSNLAVALLDDQRSILVWDVHAGGDAWSLRACFVDADGGGKGDEISFEPSPRKIDWQPCVAPAANNGFVVAWCSGTPRDSSHDVVARVFDARGKPAGPLLPISYLAYEQDYAQIARLTDKTYVVAWEDDISNYDHTYLRRIQPSGRELGPIVRLNELETKAVEDRTAPVIAVLGDGLVGAWNDRRRSQGWDVYMRILGPRFDAVKKR